MKNIEAKLLLLIVIIIVLAAMVIPGSHRSSDAQIKCACADVNGGLKTVLQMFKEDCGRYPTQAEGLKVLIQAPADGSLTNWRGPYFDPSKIPADPWDHAYIYRFPALFSTNAYDLYSLGPDGVSKSGGNDTDDIGNWERPPGRSLAAIVPRHNFFDLSPQLLWIIPILYGARWVAGIFSLRVRASISENPGVHAVWFLLLIVTAIVWFTVTAPQLSQR